MNVSVGKHIDMHCVKTTLVIAFSLSTPLSSYLLIRSLHSPSPFFLSLFIFVFLSPYSLSPPLSSYLLIRSLHSPPPPFFLSLSSSLSSCLLACFPPFSFLSLQNVVVVNSQPAVAPVIIAHHPHAPDYLTLTIVGFVLCFFCGGVVGMLLLIPALICSVMVSIVYLKAL